MLEDFKRCSLDGMEGINKKQVPQKNNKEKPSSVKKVCEVQQLWKQNII